MNRTLSFLRFTVYKLRVLKIYGIGFRTELAVSKEIHAIMEKNRPISRIKLDTRALHSKNRCVQGKMQDCTMI